MQAKISKHGQDWAEHEDKRMISLKSQGHTYGHIGTVLKRTSESCRSRFKLLKKSVSSYLDEPKEPGESSDVNKWSKEEEEALFALRQQGIPYKIIALQINRSPLACEKKYQKTNWQNHFGTILLSELEEKSISLSKKVDIRDKITASQDAKMSMYKIRAEIIADRLVAAVEALPTVATSKRDSSKNKKKIDSKKAREPEEMALVLSDLHIGAHHTLEETGGISEYNEEVVARRIENLKTAVLEIAEIHGQLYEIPVLHIFCLGDIVAGANNAGAWSNTYINLPIFDQMTRGWKAIADMIHGWLPKFPKIRFYGVRGNHGRCGLDGVEKDYCNWDYISYKYLEAAFSNNTNVEFVVPPSWWIFEEIKDHKFLLVHGDDVRGGSMPIKGLQNFEMKMASIIGKYPDYTIAGHFHNSAEMTTNSGRIIINGAFVGSDVYSLKNVHAASRPEQKVFGIHSKHGMTWSYNINLDHNRL